MADKKRVRRNLTTIVLDTIDKKGNELDAKVYNAIRKKVEAAMAELETALEESKSSKLTAAKIRRLDKFTKEEIEEYLARKK